MSLEILIEYNVDCTITVNVLVCLRFSARIQRWIGGRRGENGWENLFTWFVQGDIHDVDEDCLLLGQSYMLSKECSEQHHPICEETCTITKYF